jgi:hypothetical protein
MAVERFVERVRVIAWCIQRFPGMFAFHERR